MKQCKYTIKGKFLTVHSGAVNRTVTVVAKSRKEAIRKVTQGIQHPRIDYVRKVTRRC